MGAVSHERDCPLFWEPSPRSSRCCRRYSALAVPIPAILNFLPSLRWCGEGAAPPMGASASDNARKGQKSSLGRRKRGFSEKKWGKNLVESKNGCTFALAIQKWCLRQGRKAILKKRRRGVAQPGSAPVLGTGGRRFESCRPDFKKARKSKVFLAFLVYARKGKECFRII